MAPHSVIRSVLLVSFSVFLTVVLGVGLPAMLNAAMRTLGLPETSVTECIVMLYLLFVLYVATPRIPRGLVEVMCQYEFDSNKIDMYFYFDVLRINIILI